MTAYAVYGLLEAKAAVPDPPALFGILNGACIGRSTVVELVRQGKRRSVTVKPWRLQL
jgi:hypothetical protein